MKGRLRIILLKTLKENPGKSGAELSRIIEEKIGREPSPGSLYPLLNDLGDKEIVERKKEGKKKTYKLTEKGEEAVKGIEKHKKEIIDKVIRGLKTYEYVFGEEEVEEIIENLNCLKSGPENLPKYVRKAHGIMALLQGNKGRFDEEEIMEILKSTENKINDLVEDKK